jgi:hypothetical protein
MRKMPLRRCGLGVVRRFPGKTLSMTVQLRAAEAQVRCEQAQRRIDELVERNKELAELIAALRRRAGATGRPVRPIMGTAERSRWSAHRARSGR